MAHPQPQARPAAPPRHAGLPTPEQALEIARELLTGVGTRWLHVQTAAQVAGHLAGLLAPADAHLLVVAATLHDIGYSPQIARTGFHPLDGAEHLAAQGFDLRLAALVAHHSLAVMTAPAHGINHLEERFPREHSLLADALVYADMHADLDGTIIPARVRLADIGSRHTYPATRARVRLLQAALDRVAEAASRTGTKSVAVADCP